MTFYNLSNQEGSATISVFFDGGDTRVVSRTSASFQPLLDYLLSTDEYDDEHIQRLVDPAALIGSEMAEIAGDRVTYDLRNLYFDGKPLNNVISQHIKDKIQAGDTDWKRLVRFMLNVDENPSRNAQLATYAWVERHGLTITEDGCFLGYKAVLDNHTSSHTGPDNYINGVYYGEPGVAYHVPHNVGDVISKKRADVDDTPGGGCSVGLHVGTYAYAIKFAPVLMTVKVNPRDVVSADQYNHNIKIRVSRYEVVALNKEKKEFIGTTTSMDFNNHEQARDEAWDEFHKDDERTETVSVTEPGSDEPLTDEERAELAAVVEADRTAEVSDDDFEREEGLDPQEESQIVTEIASSYKTLGEAAEAIPSLKVDLSDVTLGHKELARKWVEVTTESSVRRYRKAHGIKPRSAVRKLLG